MGTSNFALFNASKIFAFVVEPDNMDESLDTDYISFYYDCFTENVQSELTKLGFDIPPKRKHLSNGLRSYHSIELGSKVVTIPEIGARIELTACQTSGYYEGVNLDWLLDIRVTGDYDYDFDAVPESDELIEPLSEIYKNAGLGKIHAKTWATKIKFQVDEIVNELEKVYAEYTMPLEVFARFSNGETWYQKAV